MRIGCIFQIKWQKFRNLNYFIFKSFKYRSCPIFVVYPIPKIFYFIRCQLGDCRQKPLEIQFFHFLVVSIKSFLALQFQFIKLLS